MPCPEIDAQFRDALDGVDDLLEPLADEDLDLLGRGAGQHRLHAHRRQVDRREAVDAEAEVGGRADDDQRQHDHAGEDRAADADVSESVHGFCRPSYR